MEVVDIKKMLVSNLLIYIYLHCVRSSSWFATMLATLLPSQNPENMLLKSVTSVKLETRTKIHHNNCKNTYNFVNPTKSCENLNISDQILKITVSTIESPLKRTAVRIFCSCCEDLLTSTQTFSFTYMTLPLVWKDCNALKVSSKKPWVACYRL